MYNNIRKLKYIIKKDFANKTTKSFLLSNGYSDDLIKHLKQTTDINLSKILNEDEVLNIDIIENKISTIIKNFDLHFDILYEDEDIIVVNKPYNMPTHPSLNNFDNTLGNAVCAYYNNDNFIYRPITRLDKNTSGIVLICKNRLSSALISKYMKSKHISRIYIGIVSGNLFDFINSNTENNYIYNKIFNDEIFYKNEKILLNKNIKNCFLINAPIKRVSDSIIERVVSNDGEYASTQITALKYNKVNDTTLCEFKLFTGKTHQIRVHMKYINFPIIGDFIYNPNFSLINRQALHSYYINFVHPITNNNIILTAPIFDDMKILI